MTTGSIPITGEPEADRLLVDNPLALLIGMLLDQQVPMEWAFRGPLTLQDRLGGSLDAETIAAMGPDKIEAIFRDKPAMHRYPGAMGRRTHALCAYIVEHYGGDAAAIWRAGLGGGGRTVLGPDATVGCRRRLGRVPGARARVQARPEGGEEGEGGLTRRRPGRIRTSHSTRPPTELTAMTSIDASNPSTAPTCAPEMNACRSVP